MKNMFHLRWKPGGVLPGVSLDIKIHPPDPNNCHLLAFDCMIMNNERVWKVKYIKNDRHGFIRYPDTEKWVEKRGVAECLKTDFKVHVSGYRMKYWVEFLM